MGSLSLQQQAARNGASDLESEVARVESLLDERRQELAALQKEFREFRQRYTQTVGSRLAELEELERAIKEAEESSPDLFADEDENNNDAAHSDHATVAPTPRHGLRKLFWSVARMFHPDHAGDEAEAQRRHTIMAEANRAYREGDVESLNALLGDEDLQFYCAVAPNDDDEENLASRLFRLKEELRIIEFGLKRIRQDSLYRLKLSADEESQRGRDALAEMAGRINRRIVKARHRLANLA